MCVLICSVYAYTSGADLQDLVTLKGSLGAFGSRITLLFFVQTIEFLHCLVTLEGSLGGPSLQKYVFRSWCRILCCTIQGEASGLLGRAFATESHVWFYPRYVFYQDFCFTPDGGGALPFGGRQASPRMVEPPSPRLF